MVETAAVSDKLCFSVVSRRQTVRPFDVFNLREDIRDASHVCLTCTITVQLLYSLCHH